MKTVKTENIVAVTTMINGRKNFITGFTKRYNDTLIPNYHTDVQEAHDFETIEHATTQIRQIHNQHNRKFEIEAMEIPVVDLHKHRSSIIKDSILIILFMSIPYLIYAWTMVVESIMK